MRGDDAYDVVVIGGGPGGSTASTLLKKAGYRVALIERERFPRYQIGESLLPATIHGVCRLLGVDEEIHQAGFVRKIGGTFRWGRNEAPWTFDFGNSSVNSALDFSYAYQVERARFDNILLGNARRCGVDVFEESEAEELLEAQGRVAGLRVSNAAGSRTLLSKWVVDASGNQSRFFRTAGERVFSKFFQNVAVFGYFEGAGRLPAPNGGNIFCCAFSQGWFWYIPLSDTLTSVGAVIAKEHSEGMRAGPEEAMRQFIDLCPEIKALLGSARRVTTGMYGSYRIRKDYSYCNTRFWTPGLALVGDSACFIDPVFSSGVHLATYSGMLAARSIATVLKGSLPEDISLDLFESRYRAEFSVFYDFLAGFYDMHKDEDSYFWKARKVLHSEDASNDAFLQLVAGTGTTAADFKRLRARTGDVVEMQVRIGAGQADVDHMGALLNQMDRKTAQFVIRNYQHRTAALGQSFSEGAGNRAELDNSYHVSADGLFWETARTPEFFGARLITQGLVTEEQLIEALHDQEHEKRPVGELLVRRGCFSEDTLSRALQVFHEEQKEFSFNPSRFPDGYRDGREAAVFIENIQKRLRDDCGVPVKIETPEPFYGAPPVGQVACECDYAARHDGTIYLALGRRLSDKIGGHHSFLREVVERSCGALRTNGESFVAETVRVLQTSASAKPFLDALLWRINTPIGVAFLVIGSR